MLIGLYLKRGMEMVQNIDQLPYGETAVVEKRYGYEYVPRNHKRQVLLVVVPCVSHLVPMNIISRRGCRCFQGDFQL